MNHDLSRSALSRRTLLLGLGATVATLAGCNTGPQARIAALTPYAGGGTPLPNWVTPEYAAAYGPILDDGYSIPGIDFRRVQPQFLRREVAYYGSEAPGTILIDTPSRFAYLVQPGGTAMRYGVGIGRDGFSWEGRARVQFKRAWPRWTPPNEMIDRQPELEPLRGVGMDPGLSNPLGARALYLFQNGQDTLYRLHGTPEYWSIGSAVSSGCVRFMNHDIIDLYNRAEPGAEVLVSQAGGVA